MSNRSARYKQSRSGTYDKRARDRECAEGETVLSRKYGNEPKWIRGRIGKHVIRVLTKRNCLMIGPVWRRHIEQLSAVPEAVSVPGPTTETERTGT